jgi:hypothetical protein
MHFFCAIINQTWTWKPSRIFTRRKLVLSNNHLKLGLSPQRNRRFGSSFLCWFLKRMSKEQEAVGIFNRKRTVTRVNGTDNVCSFARLLPFLDPAIASN